MFLLFLLTFVYFADCNQDLQQLDSRLSSLEKYLRLQQEQSLNTVTLLDNYKMFLEDQSTAFDHQHSVNVAMFKKLKEEDQNLRQSLDEVKKSLLRGGNNKSTNRGNKLLNTKMESDVKKLRNSLSKLKAEMNRVKVSFHAQASKTHAVGGKKTIVFRKVLFNDGNAYNSKTGYFTAPVAGRYVFSVTVLAYNGRIETAIEVNKKRMAYTFSGAISKKRKGYNYGSGSTTLLSYLKKGDSVRVMMYSRDKLGYVYKTYSTFTGFLL